MGRLGLRTVLRRALRLRCSACGGDELYVRPFVMRERCRQCGLVYEAEQGFFLGAMYVNFALTALLGLGVPLVADWLHPMPLAAQLAISVPIMLGVPVLFFHHARSLWLGLNVMVDAVEQSGRR
jgi:uncharacterized protein (DUF983 family)